MIFHHQFIVPNDFIIFFLRNIPLMLGRLRSQFAIEDATPSLAQAIEMKKLSKQGKLTADKIFSIMSQQKPNQVEKIKIPASRFEKYFSRGTPQSQIESVIFQALEEYYAKRR